MFEVCGCVGAAEDLGVFGADRPRPGRRWRWRWRWGGCPWDGGRVGLAGGAVGVNRGVVSVEVDREVSASYESKFCVVSQ